MLRALLTRAASFKSRDSKGEWKSTIPPETIVQALHNEGRWKDVRHISGVSTIPIIRPSGEIHQTIGHDTETGYFYLPLGRRVIEVPEKPTRDDAVRAAASLLDLVCDFPFQSEGDRSAWLAALLTVVGRSAIHGVTPLFAFDASTRGSGKTRLAHIICTIASGNEIAVMAPPTVEEEFRKAVTSILLTGAPMVLIDNVVKKLGGGSFDALTTSLRWTDRILGQSSQATMENLAVWFATGNNIHLASDLSRRTILCRLQSDQERPEDREGFKYPNLLRHIHQQRHLLVAQALTVIRAWFVAGSPGRGAYQWGSFEGWADTIPPICAWLGLADPLARRASLDDDQDEDKPALDAVLAWLSSIGDPLPIGELLRRVEVVSEPHPIRDLARTHLEQLAGVKGGRGIDARSLPYVLRRWKGRVGADGLRLVSSIDKHTKGQRWGVKSVNAPVAEDDPRLSSAELPL